MRGGRAIDLSAWRGRTASVGVRAVFEEAGLFSEDGMTLERARAIAPGIEVLWFQETAAPRPR